MNAATILESLDGPAGIVVAVASVLAAGVKLWDHLVHRAHTRSIERERLSIELDRRLRDVKAAQRTERREMEDRLEALEESRFIARQDALKDAMTVREMEPLVGQILAALEDQGEVDPRTDDTLRRLRKAQTMAEQMATAVEDRFVSELEEHLRDFDGGRANTNTAASLDGAEK